MVKEVEIGHKLTVYDVFQASLKDIQDPLFTRLKTAGDYTLSPAAEVSLQSRRCEHGLWTPARRKEQNKPLEPKLAEKQNHGSSRVVPRGGDIL